MAIAQKKTLIKKICGLSFLPQSEVSKSNTTKQVRDLRTIIKNLFRALIYISIS